MMISMKFKTFAMDPMKTAFNGMQTPFICHQAAGGMVGHVSLEQIYTLDSFVKK